MENLSFAVEAKSLGDQYPKLKAVIEEGVTILKGDVDVIDAKGKYWESFEVEIRPTAEYPNRFPHVFETGGKLPKIADWHVNYDGTCCIGVRPAELLACRNGITLGNFIRSEMMPYFFNQTHRRIEGYYPNGEWAHREEGIFEFYDEQLKTKGDKVKAARLIRFIAKGKRPDRTNECFCGSNEKFRKCHRAAFDRLIVLGEVELERDAAWIEYIVDSITT